jgi:C-terminal processing protease CtpA/Prc
MIPNPCLTIFKSPFRFLLAILIICLFFSCKEKKLYDPLEAKVSLKDAKEDFRIYREILEKAHPGLTEYISSSQKNDLLDSISKTITNNLTYRDFFKKLSYFSGSMGCSHTIMSLPPFISDSLYSRKLFFPFPVILLDDDLYVNSDYHTSHDNKILAINGIPTRRILDSLMIYNPIEGHSRLTQRMAGAVEFGYEYYIHFGAPKKFEVLLKTSKGVTKTSSFDPITLEDLQARENSRYYYDPTDVDFSMTINDDVNYALLRFPTFDLGAGNKQTAFENFVKNSFELLSKKPEIKDLILDLRENGGGNLYNCFLLHSYLCNDSFSEYKSVFSRAKKVPYQEYLYDDEESIDIGDINRRLKKDFITKESSGYNIPDSLINKWEPHANRFKGNVYIITNHRVCSAASYFILLSQKNGRAKVVGTETCGGAYSGNGFRMLEFKLPSSKIRLRFPYAKMIYSFGEPKTGRGIVPDYIYPDNYESYINSQDRQINFIVDSLIIKNR